MRTRLVAISIIVLLFITCNSGPKEKTCHVLQLSENKRFLVTENDKPFFWLGDTGWLLFTKLNREEAAEYFEDRRQKGFNVIQVMVLHNIKKAVNIYGDSAIINHDISLPLTTVGNSAENPDQYDYWDHVDYLIDLAEEKGLYIALVPVWGSNIRTGSINREKAGIYANWLANRYKDKSNVIWMNGGDINGNDSTTIWKTIGSTIKKVSPHQLITFHPFGRTQSSKWFHNEEWLDFNMFQSGHRRYDQDTLGLAYGEDNWKYAADDYSKTPVKPTLDGEPSYEGIPQGLHDPNQPYWTDSDVRRYAYWSVFAGGCGFTYGNNAIMQFHKENDAESSYGVRETWDKAIDAPGASQMKYLMNLMLSRPYFERIPAQDLIYGFNGTRYNYLAATKGKDYAFIYTYNNSIINISMERLKMNKISCSWYNPRNGEYTKIGTYEGIEKTTFDPPGETVEGNDWVLVIDRIN